uniref:VWA-like domain-containing protein n=1 Tax=Ignisphaera aggregans TaxID=334771 RepID=A0A7J3MX68_9CREN
MRRYTKKPLKSCMVSRVRDQVVLILDNSGSMDWWKENILEIADVAMKRKDVEIYIAPNGFIESRIENGEEVLMSDEEREELMKMTGRTIIYVGDFDGADTPIQLSWRNTMKNNSRVSGRLIYPNCGAIYNIH